MTLPDVVEPRMRRDAARNRDRVLVAGRAALDAGESLQLNEIARSAGVGVGTVYRHFPTTADLLEALVTDKLESLVAEAQDATSLDDPWDALESFLARSVSLQSADVAFATVMAADNDALPITTQLKASLNRVFERLIEKARDAGRVRPEFRANDLRVMLCGVAYANRLSGNQPGTNRRYLDAFLRGIQA